MYVFATCSNNEALLTCDNLGTCLSLPCVPMLPAESSSFPKLCIVTGNKIPSDNFSFVVSIYFSVRYIHRYARIKRIQQQLNSALVKRAVSYSSAIWSLCWITGPAWVDIAKLWFHNHIATQQSLFTATL